MECGGWVAVFDPAVWRAFSDEGAKARFFKFLNLHGQRHIACACGTQNFPGIANLLMGVFNFSAESAEDRRD